MLTENDVVRKVTAYLEDDGYKILQSLSTLDKGVDIIAEKDGQKLYIEAKGATSSKEDSNRFGKGFNKNQVKIHIAMAILASMKVLSIKGHAKAAIALPDNQAHREIVKDIKNSLNTLSISVFWVGKDHCLEE